MNYFAHGRHALRQPYVLAGTAVPDWLRVVNRRLRVRSVQAAAFVDDADPVVAAIAQGIVQHHHDDGWFHAAQAFAQLSLAASAAVRGLATSDQGMRTWFVGHVLVELLLDAELFRRRPANMDGYYAALGEVDPGAVAAAVGRIAGANTTGLTRLIPGFLRERFLPDYADDAKLAYRLGQVLSRVNLPPLPSALVELLPELRSEVAVRTDELLLEERLNDRQEEE
jgi:hypothetical protein